MKTDAGSMSEDEAPSPAKRDGNESDNHDDTGYEFRLFSTAGPAPKVILEDDNAPRGEGGFVAPTRPLSYYQVTELSVKQKQRYLAAAVSGEDIFTRSKWRSWGLELPWKVTSATATRKLKPGETGVESAESSGKRKRPGKKSRIATRTKARAKAAADEAASKTQLDKEELLKEKKKRLNRFKTLRKRAKNKGKKPLVGEGSEPDNDVE